MDPSKTFGVYIGPLHRQIEHMQSSVHFERPFQNDVLQMT
jgi:hypothetical protein